MEKQFDPYHMWLGIPAKEQPANHYRLLGLELFEGDPEVIESAADRQMAHVRTFQAGYYSQQSQEVLNALSAAKVCLVKPDQKAEYDRVLREKIAPQIPGPQPAAPAMAASQDVAASYPPSLPAGLPFPTVPQPHQVYQQPPAYGKPTGPSPLQNHDSTPARPLRGALSLLVSMGAALALGLLSVIGWMVWSRSNPQDERAVVRRNVDTSPEDAKQPVESDRTRPPAEIEAAVEPNPPPKPAPLDADPKPPQPVVAIVDPPKQIPLPQPGVQPENPIENHPAGSRPPVIVAPFNTPQAHAHQAAWAKYLQTQIEMTNSVGAKTVLLPPGEFLMGSTDEQLDTICTNLKVERARQPWTFAETPQHRVVLTKPIRMGKTEVTVGQFKQFVEATRYKTLAEKIGTGDSTGTIKGKDLLEKEGLNWRSSGYEATDESPVTQVTWNDAIEFCNWLSEREGKKPCYGRTPSGWSLLPGTADGYRLPTEAEWEYACRAGTTSYFSFGDDNNALDQHGWYSSNSGGQAHPVGTKPPNAFDLHDMHGNVHEWCHDIYDVKWYANSPLNDPSGPTSGSEMVVRGGSFVLRPVALRNAYRESKSRPARFGDLGFRIARNLETSAAVPEVAVEKPRTVPKVVAAGRFPREISLSSRFRENAMDAYFSPNNNTLVWSNTGVGEGIVISDLAEEKLVGTIKGSNHYIVSPDGKKLANDIESEKPAIRIYDLETRQERHELLFPGGALVKYPTFRSCGFDAGANKLFTRTEAGLQVWDVKTGKILRHINLPSPPLDQDSTSSLNGRYITIRSRQASVLVLDTKTEILIPIQINPQEVRAIAGKSGSTWESWSFSADGQRLYGSDRFTNVLVELMLPAGTINDAVVIPGMYSAKVSADTSRIVAQYKDETTIVRVLDRLSQQVIATLGPVGSINEYSISSNNRWVYVRGDESRLYDFGPQRVIKTPQSATKSKNNN